MYLINVKTQVEMSRKNFLVKSWQTLFPVHNIRECSFQENNLFKGN